MFEDIGAKIKFLAKTLCCLGIIASLFSGCYLLATGIRNNIESKIILGILIALLGSLFSWVGNFIMYGFGQLIENSEKIIEHNKNTSGQLNYISGQYQSKSNTPQVYRCPHCGRTVEVTLGLFNYSSNRSCNCPHCFREFNI